MNIELKIKKTSNKKQRKLFFNHLRRLIKKCSETTGDTKDLILARCYESVNTAVICDVITENTYYSLLRIIREL